MTTNAARSRLLPRGLVACLCCLVTLAAQARAQPDAPPAADAPPEPQVLTMESAVRFALENNPALATQRQARGLAAARVVIADTYPYNPLLENRIQGAEGPQSAGITNRTPLEHLIVWPVEWRHQGQYRREVAAAALSRTEWEIAYQEQTLAVQVMRAYATLLYRREKLRLLDETVRLNQQLAADLRRLQRPTADVTVAETEVIDIINSLNSGGGRRELLAIARNDLFRALGAVDGVFRFEGALEPPPLTWDPAALIDLALTRRADLRGRQMAVAEAEATVRLQVADRYGNPSVGPVYTIDPTGVNTFGVQLNVPLPFCNTRRGEIQLAQAQQAQAISLLRQTEVNVRQDVAAAWARLAEAQGRADFLRNKGLPDLRQALNEMVELYNAGRAGADFVRVIDIRRKLLRAQDVYLDALWAVRQAQADVLAAIGEPVLGLCEPPPEPAKP
jgi:cobalt-zinc-cadmium efflux system outer membrane protein